jgi:hypothetical protein
MIKQFSMIVRYNTCVLSHREKKILLKKVQIGKEYPHNQWTLYKLLVIDSDPELKSMFDKMTFSSELMVSNNLFPIQDLVYYSVD